ncbi:MAG: NAD-dependent epimerase/dehydratase family protein [Deltaproteobacteria bacterium]|nr:NAD-dependent epimerase/dehydratase family protein [Deltaproteobacteria bacterium]
MTRAKVLVLGAGFTGERVARRLEARGHEVVRTRSSNLPLPDVSPLRELRGSEWLVLHSIPLVRSAAGLVDPTPWLLEALAGKARRLVYLSTTGVYGAAVEVNETTPVAPRTPRERLRVDAEVAVAAFDAATLVLRPAAIYGPGRGAHVSIREGTWRIGGDGGNHMSRVHVEDLAALAEAALFTDLEGAYPVADEEPCTSREVTEFCCSLLGLPIPASVDPAELDETRRANRRVDGRAVCRALGVSLRHPSYRVGIPACLTEEPR